MADNVMLYFSIRKGFDFENLPCKYNAFAKKQESTPAMVSLASNQLIAKAREEPSYWEKHGVTLESI